MNKQQRAVKEFHELIGAPAPSRPTVPSPQRRELRIKLIHEELMEFAEASNFIWIDGDDIGEGYFDNEDTHRGHPDLVEVADALGDLLVVVNGAGLEFGIDLEPVFDEIHRSNMTKGGGALRGDGKALKGPLYQPPDLSPIIQQQMARDEWDDYPMHWCNPGGPCRCDLGRPTGDAVVILPEGMRLIMHEDGPPGAKISFTVGRDPGDETDAR